jgi:hypothetical protein
MHLVYYQSNKFTLNVESKQDIEHVTYALFRDRGFTPGPTHDT